ncbi:MAG: hypothetical protein ACR2NU_09550 [Aeoliella sp.]
MLGDFDISGGLGDAIGGGTEGSGCFWHIISFCIFVVLVIVLLEWMS